MQTYHIKMKNFTAQVLASYLETVMVFPALAPRDAEADGYKNNNANNQN